MLIYKINFSLFTLFSLLIYIFCARVLKGRAGCRQTEVQTNKQTNKQTISRGYAKELANRRSLKTYAKNWQTDDLCLLRQRIGETDEVSDLRQELAN